MSSITIGWATPSSSGYFLDVSRDPDFNQILSTYNSIDLAKNNFLITGLAPNTIYYIKMRTIASLPLSKSMVSIETPVIFSDGDNLRWNAVSEAEEYYLEISTTDDFLVFETKLVGNVTTYPLPIMSTPYYLRVAGSNPVKDSSYSNVCCIESPIPIQTETKSTSTTITISWKTRVSASAFVLSVSKNLDTGNPIETMTIPDDLRSFTVKELHPYRDYNLRLSCLQDGKEIANHTSLARTRLARPLKIRLVDQVSLEWDPADSALKYRVDITTDKEFKKFVDGYQCVNVSVTSVKLIGLGPDVRYYARIHAVSVSGDTSPYSVTNFRLEPQPLRVSEVGANHATVSWNVGESTDALNFSLTKTPSLKQAVNLSVTKRDPKEKSSYYAKVMEQRNSVVAEFI